MHGTGERRVDDAKTALFLDNRLPFLYLIRKVAFFLPREGLFPSSYILESLFPHSSGLLAAEPAIRGTRTFQRSDEYAVALLKLALSFE